MIGFSIIRRLKKAILCLWIIIIIFTTSSIHDFKKCCKYFKKAKKIFVKSTFSTKKKNEF